MFSKREQKIYKHLRKTILDINLMTAAQQFTHQNIEEKIQKYIWWMLSCEPVLSGNPKIYCSLDIWCYKTFCTVFWRAFGSFYFTILLAAVVWEIWKLLNIQKWMKKIRKNINCLKTCRNYFIKKKTTFHICTKIGNPRIIYKLGKNIRCSTCAPPPHPVNTSMHVRLWRYWFGVPG